jgi:cold shock CspA family protein
MTSNKDVVTPSSERLVGRVKWFNNKAGYGFITVTDGSRSGSDIFIHHSSINVENQQYRYLVQGEYVEFKLVAMENSKHEYQASNVCGINSGKLMCETRKEFKISRSNYKTVDNKPKEEDVVEEKVKMPRQTRRPIRVRGEGPRDSQNSDWTEIKKPRKTYTKKETNVKSV